MATISVSSAAGLEAALKAAPPGSVLALAPGNYGEIRLKGDYGSDVTLTSAKASAPATFRMIMANGVENLTLDKLAFDGVGGADSGYGVRVQDSAGVTLTGSSFTDYKAGSYIFNSSGVTVSGNSFTRMHLDAMDFSGIEGATIANNAYRESGSALGNNHKDFIQFWAIDTGASDASSDIRITGNSFFGSDPLTHGIFLNNELGKEPYRNIVISGNRIEAISKLGITVDQGDGVVIAGNTLTAAGSGHPLINVTPESTDVRISGNVAPSVPDQGNASWTVTDNVETATYQVWHWLDGRTGSPVQNVITGGAQAEADPDGGERHYLSGADVSGASRRSFVLDFDDGDTLVFGRYEAGTFDGEAGGNALEVNRAGSYARIDSVADLHELVTSSAAVAAWTSGDDLVLRVTQNAGSERLTLSGLADAYLAADTLL